MEIDEWWREFEQDPELLDFIRKVSEETLDSLDPIPGLVTWLKNHGLGVVPLEKEVFYQDAPQLEKAQNVTWLDPPPMSESEKEFLDQRSQRFYPDAPKKTTTPIQIGDRVRYTTAGKVQKIGEGILVRWFGSWMVVKNGDAVITLDTGWGDRVTKVE